MFLTYCNQLYGLVSCYSVVLDFSDCFETARRNDLMSDDLTASCSQQHMQAIDLESETPYFSKNLQCCYNHQ